MAVDTNRASDEALLLSKKQLSDAIAAFDLSPRLAVIARLVMEGKKDKEIAIELGLSKSTVRTYLYRIFDQLGVEDKFGVAVRIMGIRKSSSGRSNDSKEQDR